MVDYKYIRDLKREQRRLREKVKLLRQSGEEEKANKLQEKYDFIRKFYTEVTLNGKPRHFMNYTKREYQRLSQMINRLLAKINKNDPILSAYLKKHLKIGYKCMWKTDV
jgi:septation ring formation regulator EzrA